MSILLVVLPLALVLSYARGGRLAGLDAAPLRATGLVVVGLLAQVGVLTLARLGVVPLAWADSWLPIALGQVLVAAWLVLHRHLTGTGLLLVGVIVNAVDLLGPVVVGPSAPRLPHVSAVVGGLEVVVPPGDAIAAAGLVVLTHALLTQRPARERRLAAAATRAEARASAAASTVDAAAS